MFIFFSNPSSPEKSPSPKDSPTSTSSSTNKQDDDGWEVATGKKNLDKNSGMRKKSQTCYNPEIHQDLLPALKNNKNFMYMLLFGTGFLIISALIGLNYNQPPAKANTPFDAKLL